MIRIPRDSRRRQQGFSLLELIVAMALAVGLFGAAMGVYLNYNHAFFLSGKKHRHLNDFNVLVSSLSHIAVEGRGILHVSEHRIILLNKNGERLDFRYEDDSLYLNDRALSLGITRFNVEPLGPYIEYPENYLAGETAPPPMAGHDLDMNSFLDMDELDADGSGELETRECTSIGLLCVTIEAAMESRVLTQKIQVHPRNRYFSLNRSPDENSEIFPFP